MHNNVPYDGRVDVSVAPCIFNLGTSGGEWSVNDRFNRSERAAATLRRLEEP